MTTIKSVSLLPVYFQTDKNSKFLSSTIDQLIQPAQLERLNAFIGSTSTPTYSPADSYVVEPSTLRQAYQLEPALVTYDISTVVQSVITIDDLVNELKIKGGCSDNFDKLFRSTVYPYYPQIDLDKFYNYQNYYWLQSGSFLIDIDQNNLDVSRAIIGNTSATVLVNGKSVVLLNGMLVTFSGIGVDPAYQYNEFFVEGVGTSIVLVSVNDLITPENAASYSTDFYDSEGLIHWDLIAQILVYPLFQSILPLIELAQIKIRGLGITDG